jgi:hypothetical protein
MAELDKYGELKESRCPKCGGPIKPKWVACPSCGAALAGTEGEKRQTTDPNTCVICTKDTTGDNDRRYCPKCKGFVCWECHRRTGNFWGTRYSCPACDSQLR